MTDPFAPPPPGSRPAPAPPPLPRYGDPLPTSPRNGLGTAALVLGLLSLPLGLVLVGLVPAALALVLGFQGRRRARRGEAGNQAAATAGMALGAVGLVVGALVLVVAVRVATQPQYEPFRQCTQGAQTSAERDACSRELADQLAEELSR